VAAKKAETMAKKSEEFRVLFSVPAEERVIQDYAANVKGGIGGRLWISGNFICYASSFSSYTVSQNEILWLTPKEKIPFRKVTNIAEEKGTFTYIAVQTDEAKVCPR
jgi:hypothetical protein